MSPLVVIAGAVVASVTAADEGLPESLEDFEDVDGFETTVRADVKQPVPETASSVLLDDEELATGSLRTADDAIRLVPGFVLVQHGAEGKGYQFFVRGFDALHGADIEASIAGVPFNEWSNVHSTGYLELSLVPPEVISEIAVTKGPFSVEQGPFAIAGSIAYELGISERNRGLRGWYTAGTTNRHRLLVTYAPDEADDPTFVTAEVMTDDGFGQGRAAQRAGGTGRLRLFGSSDAELDLFVAANASRFDLPGIVRLEDVDAGRIALRDSYDDDQWGGESRRALLSLNYEHRGNNTGTQAQVYAMARELELIENFTGFLADSINGDALEQRHESAMVGGGLEHLLELDDHWALLFNGSGRAERVTQNEWQLGLDNERLVANRDIVGTQIGWHSGASVRFTPSRALRVDLGGRVDGATIPDVEDRTAGRSGDGTRVVLSPRASVRYRPGELIEVFAAYGRGLRPPELAAFAGVVRDDLGLEDASAPQAEPTVNDSVELGTRLTLGAIEFSAAGFGTFIERESIFDHVSGASVELGSTRRLGVELAGVWRASAALEFRADATWVRARLRESGTPVPLAPSFVTGAHVIVRPLGRSFGGLHAVAVAPRDLPFGGRSDWLWITSAVAGYDWGAFRAEVALDNLLNQENHEGAYQFASVWPSSGSVLPSAHVAPGPPLSARLTLSAAF
ncbi:MAG: TonB-dependent receptor [Myxococcota bacterium]